VRVSNPSSEGRGIRMRRSVFASCVVLASILVAAPPAGASDNSLNHNVSGPFTGRSVFDATPVCSFFDQVFDATFTAKHRKAGSVQIDGCVTFGTGSSFSYSGSFTLTTPHGGTLSGTASGVIGGSPAGVCSSPSAFPASLNFTLTVVHGTKSYKHATGNVGLTGTWCSPATPGVSGPISGVLTGHLS
jgi:hypothetical protein